MYSFYRNPAENWKSPLFNQLDAKAQTKGKSLRSLLSRQFTAIARKQNPPQVFISGGLDKVLEMADGAVANAQAKGKEIDPPALFAALEKIYGLAAGRLSLTEAAAAAPAAPSFDAVEDVDKLEPVPVLTERGALYTGPLQSILQDIQRAIIELALQKPRRVRTNASQRRQRHVRRRRRNPLNRLDSGPLLSYLSRIQNGDRVPFADHLRAAHLLAMHTNEIQDGPKRVQAMLDALEKKIGPEKLSAKDAPVGKYTPGGPDPRDYRIVNPYAGSYILPQNYKQNGQKVAGRVGWEWDGSSGYAVILVPGPPIKMGGEAETDKPQFMFGEEDGLEMPAEWGQKHDFNGSLHQYGTFSQWEFQVPIPNMGTAVESFMLVGLDEFAARLIEASRYWGRAEVSYDESAVLQESEIKTIEAFFGEFDLYVYELLKLANIDEPVNRYNQSSLHVFVSQLIQRARDEKNPKLANQLRSVVNVIKTLQAKYGEFVLSPDRAISAERLTVVFTPDSAAAVVSQDLNTTASKNFVIQMKPLTIKQISYLGSPDDSLRDIDWRYLPGMNRTDKKTGPLNAATSTKSRTFYFSPRGKSPVSASGFHNLRVPAFGGRAVKEGAVYGQGKSYEGEYALLRRIWPTTMVPQIITGGKRTLSLPFSKYKLFATNTKGDQVAQLSLMKYGLLDRPFAGGKQLTTAMAKKEAGPGWDKIPAVVKGRDLLVPSIVLPAPITAVPRKGQPDLRLRSAMAYLGLVDALMKMPADSSLHFVRSEFGEERMASQDINPRSALEKARRKVQEVKPTGGDGDYPYLALGVAILRTMLGIGLGKPGFVQLAADEEITLNLPNEAERQHLALYGHRLRTVKVPSVVSPYRAYEVPGMDNRGGKLPEDSRFAARDKTYERLVRRLSPRPTFQHVDKGFKPLDYQRIGIAYAQLTGIRCLIGDEMGLGKTIQALGLLSMDPNPLTGHSMFPACVICPASVLVNWKKEINLWLPNRTVGFVKAGEMGYEDENGNFIQGQPDVSIFSWGSVFKDAEQIRTSFQTLIVDEAHYGKKLYSKTKRVKPNVFDLLKGKTEEKKTGGGFTKRTMGMVRMAHAAQHVVLLTGTPMENADKQEMWTLLHVLDPIAYPTYASFVALIGEKVNQGVGNDYGDMTDEEQALARMDMEAKVFRKLTRSYMIRRLKSDVAEQLGRPPRPTGPGLGCLRIENAAAQNLTQSDPCCPGGPVCSLEDQVRGEMEDAENESRSSIPDIDVDPTGGKTEEAKYIKVGPSKNIVFEQINAQASEDPAIKELIKLYHEETSEENLEARIAAVERTRRVEAVVESWLDWLGSGSGGAWSKKMSQSVKDMSDAQALSAIINYLNEEREFDTKKVAGVMLAVNHYLMQLIAQIKSPFAVDIALQKRRESGNKPVIIWCKLIATTDTVAESLDLINEQRKKRGEKPFNYGVYRGDTNQSQRELLRTRFQREGEFAPGQKSADQALDFLIATTAMREGVTLTESTRAVFVEFWYVPAWMSQAEDRIYRIGQTEDCEIAYLFVPGTIDDKLMAMRARKMAVVSAYVGDNPYAENAQDVEKIANDVVKDLVEGLDEKIRKMAQEGSLRVAITYAEVVEALGEIGLTREVFGLLPKGAEQDLMGFVSLNPSLIKTFDDDKVAKKNRTPALIAAVKAALKGSGKAITEGRVTVLKELAKLAGLHKASSGDGLVTVPYSALIAAAAKKNQRADTVIKLLDLLMPLKDQDGNDLVGIKQPSESVFSWANKKDYDRRRLLGAVQLMAERGATPFPINKPFTVKKTDDGSLIVTQKKGGKISNPVNRFYNALNPADISDEYRWIKPTKSAKLGASGKGATLKEIEDLVAKGLMSQETKPIQPKTPSGSMQETRGRENPRRRRRGRSLAIPLATEADYGSYKARQRIQHVLARVNPARVREGLAGASVAHEMRTEARSEAAAMMQAAREGSTLRAYTAFSYLKSLLDRAREHGVRPDPRIVDAVRRIQPWLEQNLTE